MRDYCHIIFKLIKKKITLQITQVITFVVYSAFKSFQMQNMVDIMYISTPLPVEFCAKFQNVQYFSYKLPASQA